MANDGDEDVLFENSPLHQHLLEVGLEDVTFKHVKTKQEVIRFEQNNENVKHKNFFLSIKKILLMFLGIASCQQELQKNDAYQKQVLLKYAMKSRCIEEEDKNLIEGVFGTGGGEHARATHPSLMTSYMLFSFVVPCLFVYSYGRFMYPAVLWKYTTITDTSAFMTIVYIFLCSLKYVYLSYKISQLKKNFKMIKCMLSEGDTLVKVMTKSLRLIQEAELVARGFTLVSQNSAVWRLEQNTLHSTKRQCPQMRGALFLTGKSCLLYYKEATMWLLTECPLSQQVDSILNYLANIPLEEYGPCLSTREDDTESDKQLYNITDGFSVAVLKGINQLCCLQQSEYMRHMVLTLLQGDKKEINLAVRSANSLQKQIKDKIDELRKSYNVHSCYLVDKEPRDTRHLDKSKSSSPLCDLHVAVHSLDLHLQAALIRIRSLSASLEQRIEKEETKEIEIDISQTKLLQEIKQELIACKGCWEEGLSRLQKMEGKKNQNDGVKTTIVRPVSSAKQKQDPVNLFEMADPVMEDQVFEAYIDEEEFEDRDLNWDEYLTPEEKARKKREKDEALRVLTELKTVISVRAVEMQNREKLALERSRAGKNNTKNITNQSTDDLPDTISVNSDTIETCPQQLNDKDNEILTSKIKTDKDIRTKKVTEGYESGDNIKNHHQVSSGSKYNCHGDVAILAQESGKKLNSIRYDSCENNVIVSEDQDAGVDCIDDKLHGGIKSYETGRDDTDDGDMKMTIDSFKVDDLEDRLGQLPGGTSMPFTASLAAMAVKKSQQFGIQMESFGDKDSEDENS